MVGAMKSVGLRGLSLWAAAACALIACYQPSAPQGLPCTADGKCPTGLRCLDAPGGAVCATEPLAMEEEGVHPENDLPEHATDISRAGTFELDLFGARDDFASSCAPGRPEVFFRFTLPRPEVVYADTFGTPFDTAVTVRSGDCASGLETACVDNSCGGAQSQGAWSLAAGDYCLVVEGAPASEEEAAGKLTLVRGKHSGEPLPAPGPAATGSMRGDTCKDDNSNDAGCGCEPAQDHHYFFTVCPAQPVAARFETCGTNATWDTVLQLRSGEGSGLACNDDSCDDTASMIGRTLREPGLYWAIIDGCTECGVYEMKYSLLPAAAP